MLLPWAAMQMISSAHFISHKLQNLEVCSLDCLKCSWDLDMLCVKKYTRQFGESWKLENQDKSCHNWGCDCVQSLCCFKELMKHTWLSHLLKVIYEERGIECSSPTNRQNRAPRWHHKELDAPPTFRQGQDKTLPGRLAGELQQH